MSSQELENLSRRRSFSIIGAMAGSSLLATGCINFPLVRTTWGTNCQKSEGFDPEDLGICFRLFINFKGVGKMLAVDTRALDNLLSDFENSKLDRYIDFRPTYEDVGMGEFEVQDAGCDASGELTLVKIIIWVNPKMTSDFTLSYLLAGAVSASKEVGEAYVNNPGPLQDEIFARHFRSSLSLSTTAFHIQAVVPR